MARQFTVASYNIHGCVGKDRRRDAQRIAEVVTELDADVMGLQEVNSRIGLDDHDMQMDFLAKSTGLQAIGGHVISHDEGHYGNLLLTRHPVIDVRRIDISVSGYEPRGALDVDLKIHDQPVRVIVTHFGLFGRERREQARRLLDTLSIHENPDRLVVVLGDFNEWQPFSRSLKSINARLGMTPAPATFPAIFPLLALDRIWVWPRSALLDVNTHATRITRICSDHLPLRAVVTCDY